MMRVFDLETVLASHPVMVSRVFGFVVLEMKGVSRFSLCRWGEIRQGGSRDLVGHCSQNLMLWMLSAGLRWVNVELAVSLGITGNIVPCRGL